AETIPATLSLRPTMMEGVHGLSAIVTDQTDRKRAAEMAIAERFTRSIIDQLTEALVVCDTAGCVSHVNEAGRRLAKFPPVGRRFAEAFRLKESQEQPGRSDTAFCDALLASALAG